MSQIALNRRRLFRLLWLSVLAAVAAISLKTVAWLLTCSVGLLSDAAESVVNLVAALVAMAALHWAIKPADEEHAYGHAKAEYFSAGIEGALIFVAAISIAATVIDRLIHPQAIEDVGVPCGRRSASSSGSPPSPSAAGSASTRSLRSPSRPTSSTPGRDSCAARPPA